MLEFNPNVLTVANSQLAEPIQFEGADYIVPDSPGLGVAMK